MLQVFLAFCAPCILAAIISVTFSCALPTLCVLGALYGAIIAFFNYYRAFIENVKPERVGP